MNADYFPRTMPLYPSTAEAKSYCLMNDHSKFSSYEDFITITVILVQGVGSDLEESRKGWHFIKREQQ